MFHHFVPTYCPINAIDSAVGTTDNTITFWPQCDHFRSLLFLSFGSCLRIGSLCDIFRGNVNRVAWQHSVQVNQILTTVNETVTLHVLWLDHAVYPCSRKKAFVCLTEYTGKCNRAIELSNIKLMYAHKVGFFFQGKTIVLPLFVGIGESGNLCIQVNLKFKLSITIGGTEDTEETNKDWPSPFSLTGIEMVIKL